MTAFHATISHLPVHFQRVLHDFGRAISTRGYGNLQIRILQFEAHDGLAGRFIQERRRAIEVDRRSEDHQMSA